MTDQDNHLVTVQICILSVSVAPGTTTSTTCIHGIPSIYLIFFFFGGHSICITYYSVISNTHDRCQVAGENRYQLYLMH